MTKSTISKKYGDDFKIFEGSTFEENLLSALKDLINHSEGIWDYTSVRYDTVMNLKEWQEFSEHPQRKPYKTKIIKLQNKNYNEVFEYIIELLKDVYPYYKIQKKSEYKEDLKKIINSLIECSFNARFEIDDIRWGDIYVGRTAEERDNGDIKISERTIARYNYAITEYSEFSGKNPEDLKKKILKICNGDLMKLSEAMSTCDLDTDLVHDLSEIHRILSRDLTLTFGSMKLGWKVWTLFREIGIDTEEYLSLLGLPKFAVIKKRLLNFMSNKNLIDEMLKHMEDDLPNCYKKYKTNGYVERIDISIENAQRKKYPKAIRSDEEINEMVKKVQNEVFEYFPLASKMDDRNVILNPTHPACTSRASNSTIKNTLGSPVNSVVMTPRTDLIDDYLPTFAHEITHALHRKVLGMGEDAGVLKPGAADSISSAVMEDFSQLVDDRFESDKNLPYTKKYKGKEFPNFYAGLVTRFQVPFSLTQLSLRKEFDALYDTGYRCPLTEEQLWEYKYKFDKLAREWFSIGLKITSKNLTAFGLFDPYNPRDGVVYMRRYMTTDLKPEIEDADREGEEHQSKGMKMADAFIKKWGADWINKREARVMLHWLLLESGRNEKTEEYYKFIFDKPIDECLAELEAIGIKSKDIPSDIVQ